MSLRKKLDYIAEPADLFPNLTTSEKEANRLLVEIAQQIQKRRKELNKTQQQLAEAVSVSQPMVCQWESGDYNFTIETLATVFDSLNMKIDLSFTPVTENIIFSTINEYKNTENVPQLDGQELIFEAA